MTHDFGAVGEFHRKFGLAASGDGGPRLIDDATRDFRLRFLEEELRELRDGYESGDLPKIADALVDLVYVALGTAHLHGLPWPELFAEVQRANMAKERCGIDHRYSGDGKEGCLRLDANDARCRAPKSAHSLRGSAQDVIKPEEWRGPDIIEILMRAGWRGPALPL